MVRLFSEHIATLRRQAALGHQGWARGALGAAIGIAVASLLGALLLGSDNAALPWLVAPIGASAVLVFAVPASPLAQPWPVIGGSILSSVIGIGAGHLLGSLWLGASLAVGLSIAVMTLARCLHPPGGACALLCALGAAGPEAWGWEHLLPVTANVLALAAAGWAYNNLTGHSWPHHAVRPPQPAVPFIRYTHEDIEAVLDEGEEMLDVDVDELDALFRAVEQRVIERQAREIAAARKPARRAFAPPPGHAMSRTSLEDAGPNRDE